MRASATWRGGYQSLLDDGRGHSVTVDLPLDEDGGDLGTSALELAVLSLAGCVNTIFVLVARRRRLQFDSVQVEMEAHRKTGDRTISSVEGVFRIATSAQEGDVRTALSLTIRLCPVGVLFEQAGIPVRIELIVEPVGKTSDAASPVVPARVV